MINKYKTFLLFSVTNFWLALFIPIICQAQDKKPDNNAASTANSSITLILQPKQGLQLISDYEDSIPFANNGDTIKKITIQFSFSKVKELRTLNAALSQTLLLFPNSHPEFTVVNSKLFAHNAAARQAILPDDIGHIGRIYCLIISRKHNILDTATHASFLQDREKELNEDLTKIQQRVNNGDWDANTGIYWQLMREITEASVIFDAIDYTWLNTHRRDIYEHYYAKMSKMNVISGPSAAFAIGYLSSYWAEMNKKDPSVSWVDFYFQNKAIIGKEIIAAKFYNFIKNVSNDYKKTTADAKDLQKVTLYAKSNDPSLNDFITRQTKTLIPNLQNILLQDKAGNFQNLASIFRKTNKKYILIDFWASWCVPCREELPNVKKLKPKLIENNIAVIAISVDQEMAPWQTAMAQEGLKQDAFQFRLINSKEKPHPLDGFFNLMRVPRYVVVAKDGTVIIRETDYAPREKGFENEIISSTK